jgi:hypothetical protein
MTMLKTISAALLAASVIAAPALAAGSGKSTEAPKTMQAPKTTQAPAPADKAAQVKPTAQVKPNALNANAKMGRHHVKQIRHHRGHKKMSAIKTHRVSKATIKHVAPATKRG